MGIGRWRGAARRRKGALRRGAAAALAGSALLCGAPAAAPVQAQDGQTQHGMAQDERARGGMLGMATSSPGAVFHSAGTAIANVVSRNAGLPMTVQAFSSPNVYLPAIDSGQIAFGVSNAGDVQLAAAGEQHFEGRRLDDLRAVAILFPLRMAVYVRRDSPLQTLADLRGRPVPTGFAGQKTIVPLFEAVLATAGMEVSDLTEVRVPNVVGGATAFMEGGADAFFFALGAAKVREADASVGGLRALSIDDTPQSLEAIQRHWPAGYLSQVTPGPANTGVTEPVFVITHDAVVVASIHTPDAAVHALVRAIHENQEALAATFGSFNLMEPDRMTEDWEGVRWHPGALSFYREAGLAADPDGVQ